MKRLYLFTLSLILISQAALYIFTLSLVSLAQPAPSQDSVHTPSAAPLKAQKKASPSPRTSAQKRPQTSQRQNLSSSRPKAAPQTSAPLEAVPRKKLVHRRSTRPRQTAPSSPSSAETLPQRAPSPQGVAPHREVVQTISPSLSPKETPSSESPQAAPREEVVHKRSTRPRQTAPSSPSSTETQPQLSQSPQGAAPHREVVQTISPSLSPKEAQSSESSREEVVHKEPPSLKKASRKKVAGKCSAEKTAPKAAPRHVKKKIARQEKTPSVEEKAHKQVPRLAQKRGGQKGKLQVAAKRNYPAKKPPAKQASPAPASQSNPNASNPNSSTPSPANQNPSGHSAPATPNPSGHSSSG